MTDWIDNLVEEIESPILGVGRPAIPPPRGIDGLAPARQADAIKPEPETAAYKEGKHTVTVYPPAWAMGVRPEPFTAKPKGRP